MLKGTLDDFTLPDVFRLMSFAKKTGQIDIVRSAGEGKVYFRDGEVYFAQSSLSKEPLGQKLVRARALTDGQLMKALDEHKASGERLGSVLLKSGLVTEDQLETAVRQQIEDAIFDLLRWELGEFAWEPGIELDVEVPITVSVENLIMEASRRLDEFEVIRRKIPSGAAVLGMAATPPEGAVEINITPDEWRILVLVDGARSVNDIAQMVGLDEFGAMRVLYGLVSAGLIELISEGAAPEPVTDVLAEEQAPSVAELEPTAAEEPASLEPEPAIEEPVAVAPESPPAVDHVVISAETDPFESPAALGGEASPTDDLSGDLIASLEAYDPGAQTTEPEPIAASGDLLDADMGRDTLAALGIDDVAEPAAPAAPSADDAVWEEPTAIESFDAPQGDELVTETPVASDPFVDDLFAEPSIQQPAVEAPPAQPPAPPAPAEDMPVSSAPAGEEPLVDRAAAVRELAGLFSDDDRPRARPAAPRPEDAEGEGKKRVEDDDQITKGIISRLIDGVKGL